MTVLASHAQRPLVVVIPSYQNAEWCERNLGSVLAQRYDNYRVVYTDDASSDGTPDRVADYLARHPEGARVTLRRNPCRRGGIANLYAMIHGCRDEEIVLTVDGDDWLAHSQVMATVNAVYAAEDVWMTWGQYRTHPDAQRGCAEAIPRHVIDGNAFRDHPWCSSHLRTFRAWLFKKIAKADLMIEGAFAHVGWDVPMMFAMLEMSGERGRFLDEVLYVYNEANPLNVHKLDRPRQKRVEQYFRRQRRYGRLEEPALAGYSLPTSSMPEKK